MDSAKDHGAPNADDSTDSFSKRDGSPVPDRPRPPSSSIHLEASSPFNTRQQTAQFSLPPSSSASDVPPALSSAQISPHPSDRVFPIRSVVGIEPGATPAPLRDPNSGGSYFTSRDRRRESASTEGSMRRDAITGRGRLAATPVSETPGVSQAQRRLSPDTFRELISSPMGSDSLAGAGGRSSPGPAGSTKSGRSMAESDLGGLVTTRFRHVVTDGGHAIVTGREGEMLQRCEDEPIHIPGAVQGFGLLVALQEEDHKFVVRIVSENSMAIIGYTPRQLFALESFTDILSDDQTDNLLDHIDFIREDDADVATNGPELFTMSIRSPQRRSIKVWCAIHVNEQNSNLIVCEFELEDDAKNPLIPPGELATPEDTLNSDPTAEEFLESTENISRPLRVLRSARKRKGEAAAMEVFNIMSQIQEQLAAAPALEKFLKILVGVVKELTGFHRVMIYQFDKDFNGRVVTELVDPKATKDLYKGLNFPASDIPKQARDLYKLNRVRLLYNRDQPTARLVCRTVEDMENPLDLSYAYLRAMSPIHLKYLGNMAVRSSMSISINAFNELWGLIACHSYGPHGMRVSFPIRKMCRLVGDNASRNIERLSYASRLQARKLINTVPTHQNPSGYIIASSDDLLKLFNAHFGLLSIQDETRMLGSMQTTQEALAMLEYLRMRQITSVTTSVDITQDFPDLRYPPGFRILAGMLLVPLSASGKDFIAFFRSGQLKEVRWAGNPYEKKIRAGTEGYLEPRASFKTWSEKVVGKSSDWTEDEIETAAVLCLVYGKFIEVWRQKEHAIESSQLTKLLLANSAHEVRTPLNAIINYLEIALEGTIDPETREYLSKSHSASKSLIYVINDLLDLTKTEEGVGLIKSEAFDLRATLQEATDPFRNDAKSKALDFDMVQYPGVPRLVLGDQRKVRQAVANVVANAVKNTDHGSVLVEVTQVAREDNIVLVEIMVQDTGVGMNTKQVDSLFRDLEQVHLDTQPGSTPADLGMNTKSDPLVSPSSPTQSSDPSVIPTSSSKTKQGEAMKTLGLGLAVVARIVRNMNGQLRVNSEAGKGSRFVVQLPFELAPGEQDVSTPEDGTGAVGSGTAGSATPVGTHTPQFGPPPTLRTPLRETPPGDEITLVGNTATTGTESALSERRGSASMAVVGGSPILQRGAGHELGRQNSDGSLGGRSIHSFASVGSNRSRSSQVDQLIRAIQEPHMVEGRPHGVGSTAGVLGDEGTISPVSPRAGGGSVGAGGGGYFGKAKSHDGLSAAGQSISAPASAGLQSRTSTKQSTTDSPSTHRKTISSSLTLNPTVSTSGSVHRPIRASQPVTSPGESNDLSAPGIQDNRRSENKTTQDSALPRVPVVKMPEDPGVPFIPGPKAPKPGMVLGEVLDRQDRAIAAVAAAAAAKEKNADIEKGRGQGWQEKGAGGRGRHESLGAAAEATGESSEAAKDSKHAASNMHVLVAEDDPVNSRIVKKRLERLGHKVHLTVNGRECCDAYREGAIEGRFDVVLMDMQMPILNGLESTKAIREFEARAKPGTAVLPSSDAEDGAQAKEEENEKQSSSPSTSDAAEADDNDVEENDDGNDPTTATSTTTTPRWRLSDKVASGGLQRIPIMAVSASLLEKEMGKYVDAGFDAWILKPISFSRLSELMAGVVDGEVRTRCGYQKENGCWERGGWFVAGEGEDASAEGREG